MNLLLKIRIRESGREVIDIAQNQTPDSMAHIYQRIHSESMTSLAWCTYAIDASTTLKGWPEIAGCETWGIGRYTPRKRLKSKGPKADTMTMMTMMLARIIH